MRKACLFFLCVLLLCGGASCHATAPDPAGDTVFTSRRAITSLCVAPSGALWVGTLGGVLVHNVGGSWAAFTRTDGLPSHEVRGLVVDADSHVTACFTSGAAALWDGTAWNRVVWQPKPTENRPAPPALSVPPQAVGTHISADARDGNEIIAAVWGDGNLYRWNPRTQKWMTGETGPPGNAGQQITALAIRGNTLWAGTRRDGLWQKPLRGGTWEPVAFTQEGPADHNAQAMALFQGDLYVSTLEDGLVIRTQAGWKSVKLGTLSSDAPRQMLVFQNALYVRHGGGVVDKWDGAAWTKNVWAGQLPRKQVSAFSTDGKTMYAAQWGGWSAWEGAKWTHFLRDPRLQGVPIPTLFAHGKTLWLGTQGRGLGEFDAQTGALVRWHTERNGLSDDWVTTLFRHGDTLYAGTFVGGLVALAKADTWKVVPGTGGENVTDTAASGGGLFAATRFGVRVAAGEMQTPLLVAGRTVEAQCLCAAASDGGLWVGTRTGIYFVRVQPL